MTTELNKIDQTIAKYMKQWGVPAMRISFGIIFIWFGVLKPFGLSAAEGLLKATVAWLPFGDPELWLAIIGWWEVAIGISFLFQRTTRIAIGLLLLQMVGTFMPLVFLPKITFQQGYYLLPTLEGQYIIKNLLIISAALVLGGTMYNSKLKL
ncbi:MAG: DoxX family membrane protein [Saonia sp.]